MMVVICHGALIAGPKYRPASKLGQFHVGVSSTRTGDYCLVSITSGDLCILPGATTKCWNFDSINWFFAMATPQSLLGFSTSLFFMPVAPFFCLACLSSPDISREAVGMSSGRCELQLRNLRFVRDLFAISYQINEFRAIDFQFRVSGIMFITTPFFD